ncbi:Mor transcription activator family protein [Pseudothauera rhizosphaerae]|nr:Mor transcription activator family protein [Pseudothauera rhizosphaerae]
MKADLQILEGDLPPTVKNLLRLAGWRGAFALVREMPGARIYCPAAGRPRDEARYAQVAELTGAAAARRIYAEYRGGILEIPNCRAAFAAARDRWIRARYDAGAGAEELCRATGLSRRRLFEVLKEADRQAAPDERAGDWRGQMGLF